MLLRHWFHPLPRRAADLDLVGTYAYGPEETARRFAPLLADRGVADGVAFDPERFRAEGIWLNTDCPGVRLHAAGEVDGEEDDFSVDITFGEPLVPEPSWDDVPTMHGPARLMVCRPETIAGRKLHALRHMGRMHWRPKDLNDLRLLLERVPMDEAGLAEGIAASFRRGDAPALAREVLGPGGWRGMKMSSARWQDYARTAEGTPRDLAAVVAETAARLAPVLARLP
ncbi:MAG: nucleotidyl transferase AbiEii/AbiGii toxin family protein [Gemmataceae bacterium]|nr:nucleotidyl transferase AbiEii/AbiGii toxin family protein [Gemmataceae bacterium]